MHTIAIALALAAAPLTLPGEVVGVGQIGPPTAPRIVVATTIPNGGTRVFELDAQGKKVGDAKRIRSAAIGVIPCGPRGLLTLYRNGIDTADGKQLLTVRPLIGGGKPDAKRLFSFCNAKGEIRIPTQTGFVVVAPNSNTKSRLSMTHRSRSYGPRSQTGLPRAYAAAWTNYVPLTFDANVDEDAALEFVVVSETTLKVFDRNPKGELETGPAVSIALRRAFSDGVAPGASIRVVVGDIDGDSKDDIVVSQFDSVFSKRTRAAAIVLDKFGGHATPSKAAIRTIPLFDDEGFSVVLGVVGREVIRAQIPTGVMALSSALISGVINVSVQRIDAKGTKTDVATTSLNVDVPRAKLLGTLPQLVFEDTHSAVLVQPADAPATLHFGSGLTKRTTVGQTPKAKTVAFNLGQRLVLATAFAGRTLVTVVEPPTPSRLRR